MKKILCALFVFHSVLRKCDLRDVERRVGLSSVLEVQWFHAVN